MPVDERFRTWDRTTAPLQLAGNDRMTAESYVPERGHSLDVRIVLHVKDLEEMLEVARRSRTQRLVLHNASIRIREFRGGDGHTYSMLTLCGSEAVPEDPTILVPRHGASGSVLR